MTIQSFFVLLTCSVLAGLSTSSSAHATNRRPRDAFPVTRPMIEVGSGFETSGQGFNLLLRVELGVSRENGGDEWRRRSNQDAIAPERLIIAHFSGSATAVSLEGGVPFSFADVRFSAVESRSQLTINAQTGDITYLGLRFIHADLRRNVAIGQNLGLKVSVVGVDLGVVQPSNRAVRLYAEAAATLLGYAMNLQMKGNEALSPFHGFRVLELGGETGAIIQVARSFSVRIALGGRADLNAWGTRVQSDLSAYVVARAEIARLLEVFVQAGVNAVADSSAALIQGSPQAMIGLAVHWE